VNVTFADGSVGEFPDGTAQAVIEHVAQQKGTKVAGVLASPTAPEHHDPSIKSNGWIDTARGYTHGLTLGFDDEIVGGLRAATVGAAQRYK
jgi:glutamate-1-semialdehyde aminotransferase